MAGERARGTSQSAYLHSSVKHGDGRGRPHKRVGVGFSFKYPEKNSLYSTSQTTTGKQVNSLRITCRAAKRTATNWTL